MSGDQMKITSDSLPDAKDMLRDGAEGMAEVRARVEDIYRWSMVRGWGGSAAKALDELEAARSLLSNVSNDLNSLANAVNARIPEGKPLFDFEEQLRPKPKPKEGGHGWLHWVGEATHTGLDIVGSTEIPLVSQGADLVNAGFYAGQGDWTNAGLSAFGLVPIVGDAATAVRVARRGAKLADEVKPAVKTVDHAGDIRRVTREASPGKYRPRSRYWTRTTEFRGHKIFQRDDLIDPSKIAPKAKGRTNLELMRAGYAPFGPDGKKINLHHMLQRDGYPLAEMTATAHQRASRIIHINPSSIPSGINRNDFNRLRRDYWIKRAQDFG